MYKLIIVDNQNESKDESLHDIFAFALDKDVSLTLEQRLEALEKAVEEIKALLVLYKNNGLTK